MTHPDTAGRVTDAHEDFTEFYRRSYPLLVAQATASTPCTAGALDAVQDACTDVWIRWQNVHNPTAYAAAATRHNLYAQARSQARATLTNSPKRAGLCPPARDPGDTVTLNDMLHTALLELPDTQRLVVVAHYLQSLTTLEIASALHLTPSTVRTHLTLARRRMRTLLSAPHPPHRSPPPPRTPRPATLHALYERHADAVYGYLYLHLAAEQPAETLTGQTFRTALARPASDRPGLKPHLLHTARTLLAQTTTRGQEFRRHQAVQTLLAPADSHPHAGLLLALPRLTPLQYECIVLRYLQHLSITDSARVLNRTEGALKLLHHRALRALAHHLPHTPQPSDIAQALTGAAPRLVPMPATHLRIKAALTSPAARPRPLGRQARLCHAPAPT